VKILCIGNGVSLKDHLHICKWPYDFKLGTKRQYKRFKDLDFIAVADKQPAELLSEEYNGKIITKWNSKENFIVPKEADEDDITGTLQMKYAVELGGTIIHTVGFDCIKNRIEKDETWEWTKPEPWDMDKQQQRQWDQALMDTWKLKMKAIEHKHLNIQWRHFV
tara:strand:+ start:344 stop:835 length:492 start_codon:yes stop_codon:yes gene_type:complete